MTTVVYNGMPVRITFENGMLYFVWMDAAKAFGLPETVVRRIPKNVYDFEKKNIKAARSGSTAMAKTLAVSQCGLYRWISENGVIAEKPRVLNWIMRTYSEQSFRLNARMKRLPDDQQRGESAPIETTRLAEEEPEITQRPDSEISYADLFKLAQKNLEIMSRLMERCEGRSE